MLRRVLSHPLFQVVALYALFMATRREVWGALTRLPAATYEASSIVVRAMSVPQVAATFAGLAVLAAVTARWRWDSLWAPSPSTPAPTSTSTSAASPARAFRGAMAAVIVAQAWLTVAAPYNLVTDELYAVDRVLALVLAALALWRPGFMPLLAALGLVFAAQEQHPIAGFNWTERRVFLDAHIAFTAFLVVRRVTGAPASRYLWLILVIVGGAYIYPGMNKMNLGGPGPLAWALDGSLQNLFVACWANGFPPVDEATAVRLAPTIAALSVPLSLATLALELSAALILVHRRLTAALLAGFVLMHLGIFLTSGILFWKWIVVDVGLCVVVWRHGAAVFSEFPLWSRALAVAVVLGAPWTLQPQKLGWWDTPYTRAYDLEVVVKGGEVRTLSAHALAPYELPFVQGRMDYAVDAPTLTGTFGATNSYATYQRLVRAKTPADVERMMKGRPSKLNARDADRFDRFLRASATTLNKYGTHTPLWWLPHPPPHMHHVAMGRAPLWQGEPIEAVRVRLREVFFDGKKLHTLVDRVVREVPLAKGKKTRVVPRAPGSDRSGKAGASTSMARPAPPKPAPRATQGDRGSGMVFRDACATPPVATIALMNDITLHQGVAQQALKEGYDSVWGAVKPFVSAADASWINVEGTLSCCFDHTGAEFPDPGEVFDKRVYSSASSTGLNMVPRLARELRALGIDVVGTANNHSLDRGREGLVRTLKVLDDAGLPHTGTRSAKTAPWHTTTSVNGLRVAWLACTEWLNKEPVRALAQTWTEKASGEVLNCVEQRDEVLAAVRALANDPAVDAVVFLPSGGKERQLLAGERLVSLARDAADAGATVVASYHPHHLQTWEKHVTKDGREVPFIYNRGNWVTFEDELEQRASTLVFVGLARDAASKKARVVGLSHLPVVLHHDARGRTLQIAATSPAESAAYALSRHRFGASREHPPALPLEVRRECVAAPPAAVGVPPGELCAVDDDCAAGLACVDVDDAHRVCTAACADVDCAALGGVCTTSGWQAPVCMAPCHGEAGDCPLGQSCSSGGGARACAP
jgi:hypothetical protein